MSIPLHIDIYDFRKFEEIYLNRTRTIDENNENNRFDLKNTDLTLNVTLRGEKNDTYRFLSGRLNFNEMMINLILILLSKFVSFLN